MLTGPISDDFSVHCSGVCCGEFRVFAPGLLLIRHPLPAGAGGAFGEAVGGCF